jgi:hypothetical protein
MLAEEQYGDMAEYEEEKREDEFYDEIEHHKALNDIQ